MVPSKFWTAESIGAVWKPGGRTFGGSPLQWLHALPRSDTNSSHKTYCRHCSGLFAEWLLQGLPSSSSLEALNGKCDAAGGLGLSSNNNSTGGKNSKLNGGGGAADSLDVSADTSAGRSNFAEGGGRNMSSGGNTKTSELGPEEDIMRELWGDDTQDY